MGGGRGVAAPGSGNAESGRSVACREEGYIRYTECGGGSRSGNIVISFFVLERLSYQ